MKKTIVELREVDLMVGGLYKIKPNLRNTKFGYAYKKFSDKNYFPTVSEIRKHLLEINIDNALENPQTKEILIDPANERGYKYSKNGLLKCIKEEQELLDKYNAKEIEIEPYFSSYKPEDLTEEQAEMLKGLVIK